MNKPNDYNIDFKQKRNKQTGNATKLIKAHTCLAWSLHLFTRSHHTHHNKHNLFRTNVLQE